MESLVRPPQRIPVRSRADVTVTTAGDLATALTNSPAGTRVLLDDNRDLTGWTTVDGFVPCTVILLR